MKTKSHLYKKQKLILLPILGIFLSSLNGCVIPHEHIFDQKIESDEYLKSPASCTHQAEFYYSCKCGEHGYETFKVGETLPHSYIHKVNEEKYLAIPATCSHPASYYYSCECGKIGTQIFESGDVAPHSFTHKVVEPQYLAEPATCLHPAKYYYVCECGEACDLTYNYGTALPHVYDKMIPADEYLASEATCKVPASYYYSCSCGKCGMKKFSYGEPLPHETELEFEILKYPTNEEEGTYRAYCVDCNYSYTRTIPKINIDKYERLDYVEGMGDQYIDTGLVFGDQYCDGTAEIVYQYQHDIFSLWDLGVNYYLQYDYQYYPSQDVIKIKQKYESDTSVLTIYINGDFVRDVFYTKELDETYHLENMSYYIFALGDRKRTLYGNRQMSHNRFFEGYISKDHALERLLVPVLQKSTGKVGVLDCIHGTFYGNAGRSSENLKAGRFEDINDFTKLDYLEFDGCHYIDTNYCSLATWDFDVSLQKVDGYNQMMGYQGSSYKLWGVNENGKYFIGDPIEGESNIDAGKRDNICFSSENTPYIKIGNEIQFFGEAQKNVYINSFNIGSLVNNANMCFMNLYGLKATKDSKLIKDYIPIMRNSDHQKGLFDLVSKEFLPLVEPELDDIDRCFTKEFGVFDLETARVALNIQNSVGRTTEDILNRSSTLAANGWERLTYYTHDVYEELENSDVSPFSLFKKDRYINGKFEHNYYLTVQYTYGNCEWGSNAKVGSNNRNFHEGFECSADFVINKILTYLEGHEENAKLFINGYSRGAAVGGIIASKIIESSLFKKENVIAYLFACPNYSLRTNYEYLENVFIINNPYDLIPQLPLRQWGYHYEGQLILLPGDRSGISALNKTIKKYYANINKEPIGYQGFTDASVILDPLFNTFPNAGIIQIPENQSFFVELATLVETPNADASMFIIPLEGIYIVSTLSGYFISFRQLTDLGIVFAQYASRIGPSHELFTYMAWIYSMSNMDLPY